MSSNFADTKRKKHSLGTTKRGLKITPLYLNRIVVFELFKS